MFGRNKKPMPTIIPVMTREVYDVLKKKASSDISFEESYNCIQDPYALQCSVIEQMFANVGRANRKVIFVYLDEEYLQWLKDRDIKHNLKSESQYAVYLYEKNNSYDEIQRLWKKNTFNHYELRAILFNVTKGCKSKYTLERPKTDALRREIEKNGEKCWISPVFVSSSEAVECKNQIREVGVQALNGKTIHLGMLEGDRMLGADVVVLPYVRKCPLPDCIVDVDKKQKIKKRERGLKELAPNTFSEEALAEIEMSVSGDVVIESMADFSTPEYLIKDVVKHMNRVCEIVRGEY